MTHRVIRDIGVEIEQVLAPTAASPVAPELLQAVVGINRQVIAEKDAGDYGNLQVDIPFVDLMSTSDVDTSSVIVKALNEFGKFTIAKGVSLPGDLKKFIINGTTTGVTLPAYLRVDRTSQAVRLTGTLTVVDTTVIQANIASAAVTVSGSNVTVPGALFQTNSVAAGDLLELLDDNNTDVLRRFRITAVVSETVVTVESLNPDGVGALANGTHTNIRVFRPTYNFTDNGAKFFTNQTRPIDDGLPSGSKLYPQSTDTLSNPATFSGLYAFVEYKPTVGTPATWRIATWVSEGAITLRSTPIASVSAGPPMFSVSNLRYEVRTEEPAVGRLPAAQADIFQSYKALRHDLVGATRLVQGVTEAEEVFGPPVADNPLGLAMFIATSINATEQVMGTAIETDDIVGHAEALEALALEDEVYFITPLTSQTDIITQYEQHVNDLSAKANRRERVALLHLAIPTRTIIHDYEDPGSVTVSASPNRITIPGASFLTEGVLPGQYVELKDAGFANTLRQFFITFIVDADTVEVLSLNPDGVGTLATGAHTDVKVVTANFTAQQKVDELVAAAEAINNRRIALVEPDQVTFDLVDGEVVVGGEFLAVAIAALYTTNEPGKPLSRVDIPLVKKVSGSNDQFTPTQLRSLTSAGVMVVTQFNLLAPPIIRHEVSTDVTDVKVQQWSFTHVVDSIAKGLRKTLDPLLGQDRLTDEHINKLYVTTAATMNFFRDVKKRMSRYNIDDFGVSETQPDSIAVKITVTIPNVANNMDITLII